MQAVEGRVEVLAGDPVLLDVQGAENGLVKHPPLFLVAAQVERLGIFQQSQCRLDQTCGPGEVFLGVLQA
ncbi:hypothetical protein [Nocardiopsis sp. FR4]|uniref:hypothetical protein n=1 Tax=Nocardiopsis sp. FR4 TaxID=2605985 RepID=UPI001F3B78F6|nr:hypothetical protein [Nocardiopsis sp. FR4]